jgi:Ca-activated chloride channel family protein
LDESVLQDVAKAGDGVYVRAGNSEFGLNPIIDDIRRMEDEKYSSIVFEEFDEQFMYFLGIALFFFMLEMLIGDRRSKRHLFRR